MLKGKALHPLLFLPCRPEYCVLPVQAIRCELAGIEPVGELSMLASLRHCSLHYVVRSCHVCCSVVYTVLCEQVTLECGGRRPCRSWIF